MIYAKLIDNELIFAPKDVFIEAEGMLIHMIPPSAEWMSANGYKPVVYDEVEYKEGYENIPSYVEADKAIEVHYEAVELPKNREEVLAEMTADELRALLSEYGISTSMNKSNMIRLILSVEGD